MRQKSKIQQLAALALAFLVFLTSTGFMVDAHFCQNKLQRISLIGKAKTCQEVAECQKKCGMKAVSSCHKNEEGHAKKGCCSNESTFIKYEGDFPPVFSQIAPDLQLILAANAIFNYTIPLLDRKHKVFLPEESILKFPVNAVDIYVRLQRFLC